MIPERLKQAKSFGCETIDLTQERRRRTRSSRSSACRRSTARSTASASRRAATAKDAGHEAPATVLNSIMERHPRGRPLGIPGLYVTGDPGGVDDAAKVGSLSIRIGLGWAKSHCFTTGQCPVMRSTTAS